MELSYGEESGGFQPFLWSELLTARSTQKDVVPQSLCQLDLQGPILSEDEPHRLLLTSLSQPPRGEIVSPLLVSTWSRRRGHVTWRRGLSHYYGDCVSGWLLY